MQIQLPFTITRYLTLLKISCIILDDYIRSDDFKEKKLKGQTFAQGVRAVLS